MYLEDEFDENRFETNKDDCFNNLSKLIIEIRDFLNKLGYLNFGRDICMFTNIPDIPIVSGNIILDSATRTVESIRYCIMNCNFADAYTLLRKFRDDIFYYLYLFSVYNKNSNEYSYNCKMDKHEENIYDWINNRQNNLYIGDVLKYIANNLDILKAVKKFNLKKSFDDLSDNLNNYVHSNGYLFYNQSYYRLSQKEKIKELCDEFGQKLIYITIVFLFLLVLIKPISIMSYEYIDYLDFGDIPPKNSEYWVAPFVSEFFKKYKNMLDKNCISYLIENTKMEI